MTEQPGRWLGCSTNLVHLCIEVPIPRESLQSHKNLTDREISIKSGAVKGP